MKMRLAVPVFSGVFRHVWRACADHTAAKASDSGAKIGNVNMSEIIAGTAEGKQASEELQSQFAPPAKLSCRTCKSRLRMIRPGCVPVRLR